MNLIAQSEIVNDTYQKSIAVINERIGKSQFPYTFKLLTRFISKTDQLLKSLVGSKNEELFYSSQGLTRILIEHFIVAYYVWTKCRVDKSDDCALSYYGYYGLQELIKQENYNSKLDKSYDPQKTPLENFKAKDDSFNDVSEADILDVNKKANQFDIRHILKYLQDELHVDDEFKSIHVIFLDFCKQYNKLSSFVHGGPTAEHQTFENKPPIDIGKVIENNIGKGIMVNFEIKTFVFLLLIEEDVAYFDIYEPIFSFIQNLQHAPK